MISDDAIRASDESDFEEFARQRHPLGGVAEAFGYAWLGWLLALAVVVVAGMAVAAWTWVSAR